MGGREMVGITQVFPGYAAGHTPPAPITNPPSWVFRDDEQILFVISQHLNLVPNPGPFLFYGRGFFPLPDHLNVGFANDHAPG